MTNENVLSLLDELAARGYRVTTLSTGSDGEIALALVDAPPSALSPGEIKALTQESESPGEKRRKLLGLPKEDG